MDYDDIFSAYYTLYRAESDTPASTDDEYIIGMRLANESIDRWARYDDTFWKELFSTYRDSGEGRTIVTSQTSYDCPEDFKQAGGYIRVEDSSTNNVIEKYPIIEPHEVQNKGDLSTYAYFSGNPADGYKLNLNPAPPSSLNGDYIQFDYYKKPTKFASGSDVTEMSEPYFIVHRMLANRFRASRNPYYSSALRDAEDILRTMQMQNNSGTWSNPWKVTDQSGSIWGN